MTKASGIPEIHVWAPLESEQPIAHARMKIFIDNSEWLTKLFKANAIRRVDIMPPLPQGSYDPARDAPELQYEIFPTPDVGDQDISQIFRSIHARLKLIGAVCLPLGSESEIEMYAGKWKLMKISGPEE